MEKTCKNCGNSRTYRGGCVGPNVVSDTCLDCFRQSNWCPMVTLNLYFSDLETRFTACVFSVAERQKCNLNTRLGKVEAMLAAYGAGPSRALSAYPFRPVRGVVDNCIQHDCQRCLHHKKNLDKQPCCNCIKDGKFRSKWKPRYKTSLDYAMAAPLRRDPGCPKSR